MSKELEERMREEIEKSLPKQVGEALQKRLIQADRDAEEVERLTNSTKHNTGVINNLRDDLKKAQSIISKHQLLDSRESAVEQKERNLKIAELEYQLAYMLLILRI